MKKLIVLILMLILLSACGGETVENETLTYGTTSGELVKYEKYIGLDIIVLRYESQADFEDESFFVEDSVAVSNEMINEYVQIDYVGLEPSKYVNRHYIYATVIHIEIVPK